MISMYSDKTAPSRCLEQFILLSKSAVGAAAAHLIRQVLEAPGLYVFAELLDMPNIKALDGSPEFGSVFRLLQIFAFDTYQTYRSQKTELPGLSAAELIKLRHLSIMSLATASKCISYGDLMRELEIPDTRDLEDTIITAIYADVIRAKLDQLGRRLEVEFVAGRDARPAEVQCVIGTLENWCRSCRTVMHSVQTQVTMANQQKEASLKHSASVESKVAVIWKTLKTEEADDSALAADCMDSSTQCSDKSKKVKVRAAKSGTGKSSKS